MASLFSKSRLFQTCLFLQKALGGVFATSQTRKGFAHSVEEASFDMEPCVLHILNEGPSSSATLTREDALKYYYDMVVIRRMETAAANMYKEKAIRGFCHLCSGMGNEQFA